MLRAPSPRNTPRRTWTSNRWEVSRRRRRLCRRLLFFHCSTRTSSRTRVISGLVVCCYMVCRVEEKRTWLNAWQE